MLNLEVGKKYITTHNSPIVIDRFEFDGNKYKNVYATWPSGSTYKVNNPDQIVKLFSLNVGDEVADNNNGPYYEVVSINSGYFKTKGFAVPWTIKQIFKIKKRLPKVGEIVWLKDNRCAEFKVSEVYPCEGKFKVDGVRPKETITKFQEITNWKRNTFYTNEDVVFFKQSIWTEHHMPVKCFQFIEDPCTNPKVILFKTQKNRNGRYYEPSALDKAWNDLMMTFEFDRIARPVLAGPPGTILSGPIVTHNGITEEYLMTATQKFKGEQQMKVTDFDKDNLKAGKEDALAKKKEYERLEAQRVYTILLNQLDSVNAQIKALENSKKSIEEQMAAFG